MDKYIGKVLNERFVLEQVVGTGGMAIVYKSRDKITDRIVAIKILKDEFVADEHFRRRFLNESRAISMLTHKNIVNVIDFNFEGTTQYIVMEFIEGITLKEFLEKVKPIPVDVAINISIQILGALQHAHERGIIHRDIKPQNIMMIQDGSLKVTDFGIARVSKFETITMTDNAIGTVYYISPEQAKGIKTDEKSDIYSVGVILYEMLTGALPFEGDSPVSVALKQIQIVPRKLTEMNSTIPIGFEEIVLKSMLKDPEKRYLSAGQMIQDLEKLKANKETVFGYDLNDEEPEVNTETSNNENNGKKEKMKLGKKDIGPILGGMFSAFALVAVIFSILYYTAIKPAFNTIPVPELVGKKYSEISSDEEITNNFTLVVEYEANSQDSDTIIKQNISGGTAVSKGRELKITVSSGARQTLIPNEIIGVRFEQAIIIITNAGFEYERINENSDTVEKGKVIRTDPPAGQNVPDKSRIKIYVSEGIATVSVTVPNVIGSSIDEARNRLNQLNIIPEFTEQFNDIVPQGFVISQSIEAETEVSVGTKIQLVISKGSQFSSQISSQISSQTSSQVSSSSSSSSDGNGKNKNNND